MSLVMIIENLVSLAECVGGLFGGVLGWRCILSCSGGWIFL